MNDDLIVVYVLIGMLALTLSIALICAILRIFSIDRTLKAMLEHMRGVPSYTAPISEQERAVSEDLRRDAAFAARHS